LSPASARADPPAARAHGKRSPVQGRETFSSAILPRYLRRTGGVEELIPWRYLKGVSTGDFFQALAGAGVTGFSASTWC